MLSDLIVSAILLLLFHHHSILLLKHRSLCLIDSFLFVGFIQKFQPFYLVNVETVSFQFCNIAWLCPTSAFRHPEILTRAFGKSQVSFSPGCSPIFQVNWTKPILPTFSWLITLPLRKIFPDLEIPSYCHLSLSEIVIVTIWILSWVNEMYLTLLTNTDCELYNTIQPMMTVKSAKDWHGHFHLLNQMMFLIFFGGKNMDCTVIITLLFLWLVYWNCCQVPSVTNILYYRWSAWGCSAVLITVWVQFFVVWIVWEVDIRHFKG